MQITPAALAAIFNSFDLRYQAAYQAGATVLDRLRTHVPSTTSQTTYAWMARIPRLREWIGERVVQNASAHAYTIVNRPFELTLEVDRDQIEDDQLGVFNPMLDMMGQQAKALPDDLTLEVLQAGETELCYDGQNYFDTDHPIDLKAPGKGTQSNLLTGKPLTPENYGAARTHMATWVGEDGRPLKVTPSVLVVPPQLEDEGRRILTAEHIVRTVDDGNGGVVTSTETNIYKGTADLLVIPELADAPKDWYLFDTTKPLKPFVYQDRRAPEFTHLTDPTAENVFFRKKYIYGVDARANAGYGLWFLALKAKG